MRADVFLDVKIFSHNTAYEQGSFFILFGILVQSTQSHAFLTL